ncbi:MAG TPA: phosphoribosylpyrophosphate synthetase [Methylomirabilota bacterium]|nr:phosphoribosylpyrophosphate synthetase [Methylomirabilota bacterium]
MSQAGYATLADAIDDLTRRGFTEHFGIVDGGLRALDLGMTFRADELAIREYHRFEGVSDPDDLAIVYAIESRSGVRGILVDAFGVYSNPAVSLALADVPIRVAARPAAAVEQSPGAPRKPDR